MSRFRCICIPFVVAILISFLPACAVHKASHKVQPEISESIVESYPSQRPRWVDGQRVTHEDEWVYVIGHSNQGPTEKAARNSAERNAVNAFVTHAVDDAGGTYRLFPNSKYETQANPVQAGQPLWIPNEDDKFFLDEQTGREELYIIATAEPMPQLESNLQILRNEFENVPLVKMGAGGIRPKLTPVSVTPPRKLSMVEIKDRILATGDFAFTTWFWHR